MNSMWQVFAGHRRSAGGYSCGRGRPRLAGCIGRLHKLTHMSAAHRSLRPWYRWKERDLPKAILSVKGGSEPAAVDTSAAVTVTTLLTEPSLVTGDSDHPLAGPSWVTGDSDHTAHIP